MRTGYATDACMANDARHRAEMEVASATMLDVLQGKMTAPRNLVWRATVFPQGWSRVLHDDELRRIRAKQAFVESRRIGGDSCLRCGARPGACDHPPIRGGRLVCL